MSVFKTNFNGTLAPLIETNERYILKGQVYDKDTMKFEFMNFIPTDTDSTINMPSVLRRTTSVEDAFTNYDWHNKKTRGDMYIVDNNDPNITYAIVDSSSLKSNVQSSTRIIKFKTVNEVTEKIWDVSFEMSTWTYGLSSISTTAFEIFGQDDTDIIVAFNTSSYQSYNGAARYNQHIVKRFNKTSGEYKDVLFYDVDRDVTSAVMHGNTVNKIYETDKEIYFYFFNGYNNYVNILNALVGTAQVYKYDKLTKATNIIGTLDKDTVANAAGNTIYSSKGIKKDNEIWFYQYTNGVDPSIRLVKIDTITNTIAHSNVITTFSKSIPYLPKYKSTDLTDMARISIDLMLKEIDGKYYLNIYGYSTMAATDGGDLNKISTFLVDESNGDLIAQDVCDPFNCTSIRGVVECVDEDLLLITNREATKVLRFDTQQRKYIEMQTINIPSYSVGCDSKNNIWLSDAISGLHKFTIELPVEVQVKFEQESVDYVGKDIDTNIILESYNYKNERVATKLELTIKGPMTFDDGTKVKTISSSKTEAVKIPTTITGSGIISVFPKIIL